MTDWLPPEPGPRVLGLRLSEPLTLGHVWLLDELGSPLLHGGHILPGDVALAVFVLAQKHRAARADVSAWWAPLLMKIWGLRSGARDFDAEAEKLVEWFVASAKPPAFWHRSSSGGKQCAAPWWINRVAVAMGTLGLSLDAALDMPAKRLGQLTMAFAESRGEVELVTSQQREFREMVAKLEANKRN